MSVLCQVLSLFPAIFLNFSTHTVTMHTPSLSPSPSLLLSLTYSICLISSFSRHFSEIFFHPQLHERTSILNAVHNKKVNQYKWQELAPGVSETTTALHRLYIRKRESWGRKEERRKEKEKKNQNIRTRGTDGITDEQIDTNTDTDWHVDTLRVTRLWHDTLKLTLKKESYQDT